MTLNLTRGEKKTFIKKPKLRVVFGCSESGFKVIMCTQSTVKDTRTPFYILPHTHTYIQILIICLRKKEHEGGT